MKKHKKHNWANAEKTFAFELFGKRYCDLNKAEKREYLRLRQAERRKAGL